MGYLFMQMPTAYLPDEDQGILMVQALLPPNSTLEQTDKVMEQVQDHFLQNEKEAVESCMTVSGVNFSGRGQNAGLAFVKLRDWELRQRPDLKVDAVAGRAMGAFSQIRNAMVFAFAPPAVVELGQAKGFDFQLLDRGGVGHADLMTARNQLLGMAMQDAALTKVRPNGLEDVPQYRVDVDWDKVGVLGLPITSVHNTISAAFGSAYVNDFIQGGRVKRVFAQADAPYRMLPNDLERLYVRNNTGQDGSLLLLRVRPLEFRLSEAGAIQRLPVDQHPRGVGAGTEFRRGHGGDGRIRQEVAPGFGLRLDGSFLPGTTGRLADGPSVRLLHPGGLPVPGGLVRELADPHRRFC